MIAQVGFEKPGCDGDAHICLSPFIEYNVTIQYIVQAYIINLC